MTRSKKRIFIGSSTESLVYAEQIKDFFTPHYDCTIWKEDFFTLNQGTYETLFKKSIAFDYAIFVGGKDDFIKKSKYRKAKIAPRDNVYLEFGLYAGILSPARTFFVMDKACKVASDLDGITLCIFENQKQLESCCGIISKQIEKESKICRVGLLPSLSLAIGYYENFLKDTCYKIHEMTHITIDGKCYRVSGMKKELKIVIPNSVETSWQSLAKQYYEKNGNIEHNIGSTKNYYIRLDMRAFEEDHILSFVDIPQTLIGSFKTIEYIAGKDFIGEDDLMLAAKRKEVNNFIDVLQLRINEDAIVKSIVSLEYMSDPVCV